MLLLGFLSNTAIADTKTQPGGTKSAYWFCDGSTNSCVCPMSMGSCKDMLNMCKDRVMLCRDGACTCTRARIGAAGGATSTLGAGAVERNSGTD
jgi:hypothetical protein